MLEHRNRKEKRRFARSIVGTSQYMAPEVVDGEPYDGRCDYWSIGIIIYEVCLSSYQMKYTRILKIITSVYTE